MSENPKQKSPSPVDSFLAALVPWQGAAEDVAREMVEENGDIVEKVANLLEIGAKAAGVVRDVDDGLGMTIDVLPCPTCGNVICSCPVRLF